MAAQLAAAEAAGECLRFVGVVDLKKGAGSVELRRYPKVRALAASPCLAASWSRPPGLPLSSCARPAPNDPPLVLHLPPAPQDHPFAQLSGSDNIIAFTTQRYSADAGMQPLIVRGPGAGAEVTAGGVFSDLLRLAAYLGAPS